MEALTLLTQIGIPTPDMTAPLNASTSKAVSALGSNVVPLASIILLALALKLAMRYLEGASGGNASSVRHDRRKLTKTERQVIDNSRKGRYKSRGVR